MKEMKEMSEEEQGMAYEEMYRELEQGRVDTMKALLQMLHAFRDGKDFYRIAELLDRLGFQGGQIDEIMNAIRLA